VRKSELEEKRDFENSDLKINLLLLSGTLVQKFKINILSHFPFIRTYRNKIKISNFILLYFNEKKTNK
jgi:hypothetical protein